MVWLKFLLYVVITLFAGTKTARYADIIAEKTGLGRIWVGLVLVAAITSMPELVTGVSSVTLVGEAGIPDLGLGTLLGSCIFNLSILAVLDVLYRDGPVLNQATMRQIASAGVGILLFAIVAVSISFGEKLSGLALGWVGAPSIIVLVLYLLGAWWIFSSEHNHQLLLVPASPAQAKENPVVRWLWFKFVLAALAVIGAGVGLSFVGNEIAETTQWDTSFVGSLFLAMSTSMPELVVAIAALRLGAIDLAVADILGANMLDVTYVFLLDLFYTKDPILSSVSGAHFITTVVAIAMSLLVIIGLRFRQKRKTFIVISWYGLLLIGLYIFGAYALFTSGMVPG
ncbi:sodium:calcium antiporter [Chloroflexota bacterium]